MNQNELTLNDAHKINTYSLAANGGDAITAGHALAGAWLAGHVLATENPSASELAVHTLASISDFADGKLKRWSYLAATSVISKSAKTVPPQTTAEISDAQWQTMDQFGIVDRPGLDHWVDKGYIYAVSPAVVFREYKKGHTLSAGLIALNLAAIIPRDVARTLQKNEIKNLGGDNHATKLGRYKTLIQNIGIGVFLSPVERFRVGRALGIGIFSLSTIMGINDYRKNIPQVRYARLHPKKRQH